MMNARWMMNTQNIIDAIGMENTLKLAKAYGGTTFYIPKTQSSKNFYRLAEVIGEDNARKLCDAGYGDLEIPRMTEFMKAPTNQAIGTDSRSAREVARAYGVSERWVRHLRSIYRSRR